MTKQLYFSDAYAPEFAAQFVAHIPLDDYREQIAVLPDQVCSCPITGVFKISLLQQQL